MPRRYETRREGTGGGDERKDRRSELSCHMLRVGRGKLKRTCRVFGYVETDSAIIREHGCAKVRCERTREKLELKKREKKECVVKLVVIQTKGRRVSLNPVCATVVKSQV